MSDRLRWVRVIEVMANNRTRGNLAYRQECSNAILCEFVRFCGLGVLF
ncbi:hypothetical protein [Leptolyngbya ohadii]|nr:hypothetical protein [Leptolyngbya ohadii]